MVFYKFHGNGNDFIIINSIDEKVELTESEIGKICDRKVGVGADGLIIIEGADEHDFKMSYYNSDGYPGTMCGNGGRCIASFAFWMGIAKNEMSFLASDGVHRAGIIDHNNKDYWVVDLQLNDVTDIEANDKYFFLNTGSPHYVEFVKDVAEMDVYVEGRKTRYSEKFGSEGTNVNFVEITDKRIFVRTYERGVENETLSCGTGVAASAIASYLKTGNRDIDIHTTGGEFKVRFDHVNVDGMDKFVNIWLTGPAKFIFKGEI